MPLDQRNATVSTRLVSRVLAPSGLRLSPAKTREAVRRLVEIAEYAVTMNSHRAERKAPKRTVGRPRVTTMRQLFGSLAGFWFEFTGDLPGVSYRTTGEVGGAFVSFSQALCRELAIDLGKIDSSGNDNPPGPAESALIKALNDVCATPVRVRTWLRALGLPQLKGRLAKLDSRSAKPQSDPLNSWLQSKCVSGM